MIDGIIERKKCILSDDINLRHLHTFKKFPIYCGCVTDDYSQDLFCDMSWDESVNTGIIQLKYLIPLELLYYKNHNPGSVGKTWKQHHKNFSTFIKKSHYSNILEIGGSTGNLFNNFIDETKNFNWVVLEPSSVFKSDDKRVTVIKEFFEDYDCSGKKFDAIIHSHVLEHVYDPIKFVKKVSDSLDVGGNQYISIPNMEHWLKSGYTNSLFFEHTYYIDIDILEFILNKNNFIIDEVYKDNHSIFVKSVKVEKTCMKKTYFENPKRIFLKYIDNLISDVNQINSKITNNDKVFLFGAHIFSQTLLSLGLNGRVINILDNDKQKQDKRLYGTELIVKNPEILCNYNNPKVILRTGAYTSEIKKQLLLINSNIEFY